MHTARDSNVCSVGDCLGQGKDVVAIPWNEATAVFR